MKVIKNNIKVLNFQLTIKPKKKLKAATNTKIKKVFVEASFLKFSN